MRTLYQIDAFTKTPFSGNPAGVVVDAQGLNEQQMLAIAAELKNSETAFIFPSDGEDHGVIVRFFTPAVEVPTCGHATISTHFVRTLHDNLSSHQIIQKTGTGLRQKISVVREGDEIRVTMNQGNAIFGDVLDSSSVDRLIKALGITSADLVDDCVIQIISTGNKKVIVPLKSRKVLDRLDPDNAELDALSKDIDCPGYMIYTLDTPDESVLTCSRMFAPALGIPEDPVTGNGHGPLGAYLHKYKMVEVNNGALSFKGRQGVAMGRPGEVDVDVIEIDGELDVTIHGEAIVAFKAELNV